MSHVLKAKIQFLEYFFNRARTGMGPADSEIYAMIMEDYENLYGMRVPAVYRDAYITDEEDGS